MIGSKFFNQFFQAVAAGNRESAQMIRKVPSSEFRVPGFWRHEVGQAIVGLAVGLFDLLTEKMEGCEHFRTRFVAVKLDVVAEPVGRKEAVNAAGSQQPV